MGKDYGGLVGEGWIWVWKRVRVMVVWVGEGSQRGVQTNQPANQPATEISSMCEK